MSETNTSPHTPSSLFKFAHKEPWKKWRASKQVTKSLYLHVSIMGGCFCLCHHYLLYVEKLEQNGTRYLWNREAPFLIRLWIAEIIPMVLNFHITSCALPSPVYNPLCNVLLHRQVKEHPIHFSNC